MLQALHTLSKKQYSNTNMFKETTRIKANVLQKWFEQHTFDVLTCPSNSPDLNPTEHLWNVKVKDPWKPNSQDLRGSAAKILLTGTTGTPLEIWQSLELHRYELYQHKKGEKNTTWHHVMPDQCTKFKEMKISYDALSFYLCKIDAKSQLIFKWHFKRSAFLRYIFNNIFSTGEFKLDWFIRDSACSLDC